MRSDQQPFKYMLSLIEKLKQVKDFRKDKGKRHTLWIVLVVIILGTMLVGLKQISSPNKA
jgi:hypothetical protein